MNILHPSYLLKQEWTDIIRAEAPLAEQQGYLTAAQLELAYKLGWFRLFVPDEGSGPGISLPDALRLEEALSWADGSMGWTITLCSGAGWFSGFFTPDLLSEIFTDRKVCLGGSGAPTGTATLTEGGYVVTGRWKYASGAAHLSHFTANCLIMKDGENVLIENGDPLIAPFIFERKEVNVINDWQTIGLKGTSSHSFEVKDLFVPSNRCFKIAPEALKIDKPVYKYPFLQFAEVTLAVNSSGMAIHFLDFCKYIFTEKIESKKLQKAQQEFLTEIFNNAEHRLTKARADFYKVTEKSWQVITGGEAVPETELQQISCKSRKLASVSLEVVDLLYPHCGLLAADPASEINRVWRDIHTASQHSLLTSL